VGGKTITLQTGTLAKQARRVHRAPRRNQSCSRPPRSRRTRGRHVRALTSDYRERAYAPARPRGFFKREMRPRTRNLTSRLTTARSALFPKAELRDLGAVDRRLCDAQNDPDVLGITGAPRP